MNETQNVDLQLHGSYMAEELRLSSYPDYHADTWRVHKTDDCDDCPTGMGL